MAITDNLTDVFNAMWPLIADRLQNTLIQTGSSAITSPPATAGAPVSAQYLTLTNDSSLTAERMLAAGNLITLTDGGANSTLTLGVDSTKLTISAGKLDKAGAGTLALSAAGNYTLTAPATGTLALGAGTLAVGSANDVTGAAHTHAIASSSNPGAAASLLASDAAGKIQLVQVGLGVAPAYPLHILDTGVQARLAYDSTHLTDVYVDSGGNLKLAPTGVLIINAGGDAVVPNINYSGALGQPNRKWLTLDVAELHAEILVAREKVVTIGGRFMVAAGGLLIGDCPAGV